MATVGKWRALPRVAASVFAAGSVVAGIVSSGALASGASEAHVARSARATAQAKHAPKALTGSISYAELPGTPPNYIFPFAGLAYFSVSNQQYLDYLMYRPLYWYGTGQQPTINYKFSVAKAPIYSNGDKTVTINLNHYVWSNGETVTANDVKFWMNMFRAEKTGYAGYSPGAIPDDVAAVDVTSPTQIVFHLTGSVNPTWFTYNELSQITPMPMAWDVTGLNQKPGSQACATASYTSIVSPIVKGASNPVSAAAKSCAAVYDFLSIQSGFNPTSSKKLTNAFANYTTSPIWTVVDGPWKLSQFNATGNDVFVPNPKYTGPVKPTYGKFVLQYFTTDASEYNSLLAGTTDIGYVPVADLPGPAKSATQPGPNTPRLSSKYNLVPQLTWAIAYSMYNMASSQNHGIDAKLMRQLYVRQAMAMLQDQPLYVKKLLKGYGTPGYGPVPVEPPNPFVTKYEQNNPYPYNPGKAVNLLKSHGWKIVPNGTDVCEVASKCGVPKGTPLSLTEAYATGQTFFTQQVIAEDESWASAGIHVKLLPGSFTVVAGEATPTNHNWDMADYGVWIFAPDYYPTGEPLWLTGAGSNAGSYSNPIADRLIKATNVSNSTSAFAAYENFLAKQLPWLWEPNGDGASEVAKNITGATPLNSLYSILPETWHIK